MSPSFQFLTQELAIQSSNIWELLWRLWSPYEDWMGPLNPFACLSSRLSSILHRPLRISARNYLKKLNYLLLLIFLISHHFHDWFWPLPPLAHTVFAFCCIINPPIQISDSNAGPPLWQFFKEGGRNMSHCLIQALALNNWVINHGWHYHCHFIIKRTMSNTSSACLSEHYQLFCLEQITSSIWASMCTSVKQGCSGRNLRLLRRQPWNRAPRQCLCPSWSSQKRALRPPACNPPKTVCWT